MISGFDFLKKFSARCRRKSRFISKFRCPFFFFFFKENRNKHSHDNVCSAHPPRLSDPSSWTGSIWTQRYTLPLCVLAATVIETSKFEPNLAMPPLPPYVVASEKGLYENVHCSTRFNIYFKEPWVQSFLLIQESQGSLRCIHLRLACSCSI